MSRIRIYKITNLINKKTYIGLTISSIERRWYMHNQPSSQCKRLRNSLQKHGKENFTIEEIYVCFDEEHANEMEDYFIKLYNSMVPCGYNLREGGRYGRVSEESKEANRQSQYNRWSDPKERKRQSINMLESWKNDDNSTRLTGISHYVENKKRKVVGINIESHKLVRYDTVNESNAVHSSVSLALTGRSKTCDNHCWFYDTGQSKEELIVLMKEVLSTKKSNWKDLPGKEVRLKNMRDNSSHRFKSIIAVDVKTLVSTVYENVHDAIRDGYSSSSIYGSLKKKCVKGQGSCWFYYDNSSDFIALTKERLGIT